MELKTRELAVLEGQLGKSERIPSDRCTFPSRVAVASKANLGTDGKVTVMLRLTEDTLVTSRLEKIAVKFPSPTEEQLTAAILVCGVNSTSMPAGKYTLDDVFSANVEVRTRIPKQFDTTNGVKTISKYWDACRILGISVNDYPQIYMYVVDKRELVVDVKTAFGGNPWNKTTFTPPAVWEQKDFPTMSKANLKKALDAAEIAYDSDSDTADLKALAVAQLVGKVKA